MTRTHIGAIRPREGDLVVRPEFGPRRLVYVLSSLGARWETTYRTYNDAVHVAQRTAHVYNANIWFTKDGVTFDLVSSWRADT